MFQKLFIGAIKLVYLQDKLNFVTVKSWKQWKNATVQTKQKTESLYHSRYGGRSLSPLNIFQNDICGQNHIQLGWLVLLLLFLLRPLFFSSEEIKQNDKKKRATNDSSYHHRLLSNVIHTHLNKIIAKRIRF